MLRTILAVLALALAAPAVAAAAPSTVAMAGGELLITGTPDHNNISIFREGNAEEGRWLRILDVGHDPILLADRSSCAASHDPDCHATTATCSELGDVNCDLAPIRRMHLVLGSGDDNNEALALGKLPVTSEGGPGDDELFGEAGDDTLLGGPGRDSLSDHTGQQGFDVRDRDTLDGGPGGDELFSSGGPDVLIGGTGADEVYTAGRARVYAGPGSDHIFVFNHRKDTVDCGAGHDRVLADRGDVLRHCGAGDAQGALSVPRGRLLSPGSGS
jgi:hypothetical protein